MILRKIIVANIDAVGMAAMETAERWNLRRGGRIPKREFLANRKFVEQHRLEAVETGSSGPVEQNMRVADGLLAFMTHHTKEAAREAIVEAKAQAKPWLEIDLSNPHSFRLARRVFDWLFTNRVRTLFVFGPATEDMAAIVGNILETAFQLDTIESAAGYQFSSSPARLSQPNRGKPRNIDHAVQLLLETLTFKEKTRIARSREDNLTELYFYLGEFIRNELRWWEGNPELLTACLNETQSGGSKAGDASEVIIRKLIQTIRESHALRVVTPQDPPDNA